MFGLSPTELMVVAVIALLLFGSKLPEVARSLGSSYRDLRKGLGEFQEQMRLADLTSTTNQSKSKPAKVEYEEEEAFSEPAAPKFTPPPRRDSNDVA